MRSSPLKIPAAICCWIVLCAFCNCAGWILSACHELNRTGYATALLLLVALSAAWLHYFGPQKIDASACFRRLMARRARFRRWLPKSFLALAALAILGGVLYPPTNYDGLAYRTPRVLHWLAAGQWHWIHTEFNRLNTRAPGYEWVCAPMICLTGTDRFLFLINACSFCLLPGLVFSVFRRLGISGRVAWHWMWLAPTGYCFVLQAGGIANDLSSAVFALAAMDFALRARESHRARDVFFAMLATGLMTAAKTTTLPLALPIGLALLPALPALRRRMATAALVALVATVASFVPSAVLNVRYSGDWSGLKPEHNEFLQGKPLLRVAHNAVLTPIQNFTPPVFPFAGAWNRAVLQHMPMSWRQKVEGAFETDAAHLATRDMVIEEVAPLGLGVSGLLLFSAIAGLALRHGGRMYREPPPANHKPLAPKLILACVWIAFLVLLSHSGVDDVGRLSAPYYLLLAPAFLLAASQARVVRSKSWRLLAAGVLAMAALLVVLSPSRPLWPAKMVLSKMNSSSPIFAHARTVYELHEKRADALAPARDLLPPGLRLVGLISFDDPETSLWRPFGSRRVEHLTKTDTLESCHQRGLEYVLIHRASFDHNFGQTLEQWTRKMCAHIESKVVLKLKGTLEADDWLLVKLAPAASEY